MVQDHKKRGLLADESGSRRARKTPKALCLDEVDEVEELDRLDFREGYPTYNRRLADGMLLWAKRGDL